MAKKTQLSITLPDGTTATRTTANAYKVVITGRLDLVGMRAFAGKEHSVDASNYAYHVKVLSTGAGNSYPYKPGVAFEVTEAMVAEAKRRLEGCSSAQDFSRKSARERVANTIARHGNDDLAPWEALQWSGSMATAQKALNGWRKRGWTCLTILPITQDA